MAGGTNLSETEAGPVFGANEQSRAVPRVATGSPATGDDTIRCQVFRNGRPAPTPANLSNLSGLLQEQRTFVWFDLIDPTTEDLALLQQEFALHPLAVEDAVQAHQRPKIVSYGEGDSAYWFIVVQPAVMTTDKIIIHEMALFAGRKFLVTVRFSPVYPIDEIDRRWLAQPDGQHCDSGFLLYTILDTVVDGYFPVAERFEERVDALEVALFADRPRSHDLLLRIFTLKKEGQQFRRAAFPLRDILAPIVRGDLPLLVEEQKAYFRDVYDHAVRVIDQVDATRDLANSALEVQLSVTANRQNEVSKQLTVIATIFLPLTFITGFFGQNFGVLVGHITGPGAFWVLGIGTEVVVLALLLIVFKRRGWF
jgi:magnesium transporter